MYRGKKLRYGFTTGTCAAIASKAAAIMVLSQKTVLKESILTPKGILIETDITDPHIAGLMASCAVKKDAGDDPDVTDGLLVYSSVELKEQPGINIDGGAGVGRVTKKGLNQDIGKAAINTVPRNMIADEVQKVFKDFCYTGGADVIISVPGGCEAAEKTFNPRLGIEGGISILGTTGIVEPMSETALLQTIGTQMHFVKANGIENLILTPGSYGEDFIKNELGIELSNAVKCSNFIGEAIDMAADTGFKSILIIGHMGKLIKLAAGIMNTHSRQADGRMEIFTAHAALSGAPLNILKELMECVTTDEAAEILKQNNLLADTMESILKKIQYYISKRCGQASSRTIPSGAVLFSNTYGILGMTEGAGILLGQYKNSNTK